MLEKLANPRLNRTLTLPWLVFYGLGVTVGAGIFALIGEVIALAGDRAPLAFLFAGAIAGATGLSYALLVRIYPKAGGEAVFVHHGLGPVWAKLVGYAVVTIAIVSSAAISIAFTGYARQFTTLPQPVLLAGLLLFLALIAARGIRESVTFAAAITFVEVATLIFIIAAGLPGLATLEFPQAILGTSGLPFMPVIGAALLAFFAFIGFEDIENMAEETIDPERTIPLAILWTLAITLVLYVLLALVAVSSPARDEIAGAQAPVALLFNRLTGMDSAPVSVIAALAMTNGILVQIVMAARVLYGMANEGLAPTIFGKVNKVRRTPALATFGVAGVVLALALLFPIAALAGATSSVVIAVFALVNLSLWRLGNQGGHPLARKWRYWGLAAFIACLAVLAIDISARFGLMN